MHRHPPARTLAPCPAQIPQQDSCLLEMIFIVLLLYLFLFPCSNKNQLQKMKKDAAPIAPASLFLDSVDYFYCACCRNAHSAFDPI